MTSDELSEVEMPGTAERQTVLSARLGLATAS
jgi:hypothetical protein